MKINSRTLLLIVITGVALFALGIGVGFLLVEILG